MKTTTTSTYYQNQCLLQISPNMSVELLIKDNPLNLTLDSLFSMAARVNKKRGFLFVSKILGKHIPTHPLKPLLASGVLALEFYERSTGKDVTNKDIIIKGLLSDNPTEITKSYSLLNAQQLKLKGNPVIIGFAETATALGHAFFDCISNAYYIHTTREIVEDRQASLNFEEEHSHAVDQLCYIEKKFINNSEPIILIDDEITTGKTAINIIRDIHRMYPRKQYSVISILDWRSDGNKKQFFQLENELGITITVVSLLAGNMHFLGETIEEAEYNYEPSHRDLDVEVQSIDLSHLFTQTRFVRKRESIPFIEETGRFGMKSESKQAGTDKCSAAGEHLKKSRVGPNTLSLGTGEFMYLPMRISSYMGEGVQYHSTTRSPIFPQKNKGYAIQNGYTFLNPENTEIVHYVYNIPKNYYDDLFLFCEKDISEKSLTEIIEIVKDRGIRKLNIVTFSTRGGRE
ncbi:phosphoribosyltransferase family protein [Sutcliffiella halmapala]